MTMDIITFLQQKKLLFALVNTGIEKDWKRPQVPLSKELFREGRYYNPGCPGQFRGPGER